MTQPRRLSKVDVTAMQTSEYQASSSNGKWPKVTRERPCPRCGHTNRCTLTSDGQNGVCGRSGSLKPWGRPARANGSNGTGHVGATHHSKPSRKTGARAWATREMAIDAVLRGIQRDHPDAS